MRILDAIGNTSMVQLRKIVPSNGASIFAKLEWENPTGSFKDRMALAVISRAEEDGRLKSGDTVIEYTGGGTCIGFLKAPFGWPEWLGPRRLGGNWVEKGDRGVWWPSNVAFQGVCMWGSCLLIRPALAWFKGKRSLRCP